MRSTAEKQLEEVQAAVDGLIERLAGMKESAGGALVAEKLDGLAHVSKVFDGLPPFQKKELIRFVLTRAEVSAESLKLSFRGRPPDPETLAGKRIERDGSSGTFWFRNLHPNPATQSVQF